MDEITSGARLTLKRISWRSKQRALGEVGRWAIKSSVVDLYKNAVFVGVWRTGPRLDVAVCSWLCLGVLDICFSNFQRSLSGLACNSLAALSKRSRQHAPPTEL